jgi:uncharacterized protein YebE (UPF0316 family)
MLELLLSAAWIFVLRLVDVSIGTVRMLLVVRGQKGLAWLTGFATAFVFILAVRGIFSQALDPLRLIGYAAGFATGNVVGMWLEERLAVGLVRLQIVSPRHGLAIVSRLRQAGYGVTEAPGRGRDGAVSWLVCTVLRRDSQVVERLVEEVDPEAFITEQDMRAIQRGTLVVGSPGWVNRK